MNLVTALAIVIGVLGAIATWLFLGPLGGTGLQIWAAFIAWASYYGSGGGEDGLVKSVTANVWGALLATIALILIGKTGVGLPGIAVIVGITVCVMILGAHLPALSAIPAAVYGYAGTVAYALMKSLDATDFSLGSGPFTTIAISMVVGGLFGYASQKIAGALVAEKAT
jgi:hypothetical protein